MELPQELQPVLNTLVEEVANNDLPATVLQTGCIGMCTLEPIVEVFDRDDNKTTYVLVDAKKAKEIAKEHLKNDKIIDEYTIGHYKIGGYKMPAKRTQVLVCAGTGCTIGNSGELITEFEKETRKPDLKMKSKF